MGYIDKLFQWKKDIKNSVSLSIIIYIYADDKDDEINKLNSICNVD